MNKPLREGFTTGTAASAAAAAAMQLALTGHTPKQVTITLPPFEGNPRSLTINILRGAYGFGAGFCPGSAAAPAQEQAPASRPPLSPNEILPPAPYLVAWAEVEKDGGDDPDATRRAHIIATVELFADTDAATGISTALSTESSATASPNIAPRIDLMTDAAPNAGAAPDVDVSVDTSPRAHVDATLTFAVKASPPPFESCSLDMCPNGLPRICIDGGTGVGRVTLPGLPMPVGAAAINPVPRQQISHAVYSVARRLNYRGNLRICISVPEGEALARHTLNGRLGIVGGISILGTQGTVKPFSHSAWKATIVQGLNVAHKSGCAQICLSTGRRSEKLLMARYPHLPAQAFIQAADFAKFSLEQAGQRPFFPLVWACFFGKLLKLAEGHPYTHARSATLDMRVLSTWCHEHHLACAEAVGHCVTASHALDCLLDDPRGMDLLRLVAQRAAVQAQNFAGKPVRVHLFHIQGQELLVV